MMSKERNMNRLDKEVLKDDLKGAGLDALFNIAYLDGDIDKTLHLLRMYHKVRNGVGNMRYKNHIKDMLRANSIDPGQVDFSGKKDSRNMGVNMTWEERDPRDFGEGTKEELGWNEVIDNGPTYLDSVVAI